MSLVNVHNEWDPLEEMIIGNARNARLPVRGVDNHSINFPNYAPEEVPVGPFDQRVIEEAEEDLAALGDALRKLGVVVRRPETVDHSVVCASPGWRTDAFHNYCPRDSLLTVGTKIIEAPMALRSRYFETWGYRDMLLEYMNSGSTWLSAPKPRLPDELFGLDEQKFPFLNELEPVFDAANILRMGTDILYLISSTGNEMGARWLESVLGPTYKVHRCRGLYLRTHIDSTITLVRPGLVVLNPERVNERNLPPVLANWDHIWAPEMVDIGFVGPKPFATIWIGMNFIMARPNLAIVDRNQVALIKALEKHKVEVLPLSMRHARTLGGGFHCVTLDVRRQGTLETYT